MSWPVYVLVAPVTVDPDGGGPKNTRLTLPTLRGLVVSEDRREWFRGKLRGENPDARAREIFEANLPELAIELVPDPEKSLSPVGFHVDSQHEQVHLIYTAALPMAIGAAISDDEDRDPGLAWLAEDRWVELCEVAESRGEAEEKGSDAIDSTDGLHAGLILDYWRQALEESSAGLLFLPDYFTMSQLRDVYSAVWGYEQDATAFRGWAEAQLGMGEDGCGALEALPNSSRKTPNFNEQLLQAMTEDSDDPLKEKFVEIAQKKRWYGISERTLDSLGEMARESIDVADVIRAGGRVAYQASDQGQKPDWYQNKGRDGDPREMKLASIYRIRPSWQKRPKVKEQ